MGYLIKSSQQQFQLAYFYHGLQLQLVLYLAAAEEMMERKYPGKTIHPAGMFFCRLQDPILTEEDAITDEEAEEKLLREMRPDGRISTETDVMAALDSRFAAEDYAGTSDVVRAGRKKDGTFTAYSAVMDEEDFQTLERFTRQRITSFAKEILSGNIAASPCTMEEKSPCSFCAYGAVCGMEPDQAKTVRQAVSGNEGEILERMRTALREEQDG